MRNRPVLVAVTALALVGAVPATAHAAQPSRTALPGSAPSWANAKNLVGTADTSATLGFRVYLGWQGDAEGFARAVSDPSSASYGKFLTAAQFRNRFAPSQAQVGAVQSWLRAAGFTVDHTPQNNHYVAAEGTVAQAAAAFGVTFGSYRVKGKTVRAPESDVSLPSSLAGTVEGVVGLDESAEFVGTDHVADAPPSAGFRNAPPLSTYWAEFTSPYAYPAGFKDVSSPATAPWTVKGYLPAQIKSAYGLSGSPYDGSGQTVAVIDAYASPTILSDVNTWSVNRGLPTLKASQFRQVIAPGTMNRPNNNRQDPSGWYSEESLDIEAVHGMAPGANIVYVGAPNNHQDLDAALNHVVDQQLAQIVTNSYGFPTELLPRGFVKPLNDTLIQAAVEGIGVYFSSGDNGDESANVGYTTADFPASSPWVTAVGGTALAVGQAGNRVFETGWGTSNYNCNTTTLACTRTGWLYGAGGGTSVLFKRPWYQDGTVTTAGRGVPDVSALADPQTGMLVGLTQSFPNGNFYDEYRIGGTSLASPVFAGLMALADQAAGHPLGFANPLLYKNQSALTDVTSVKTAVARRNFNNSVDASGGTSDRLRTFDDYSGSPTQHTGPGWDNVTGLGSPNVGLLSLR